MLAVGEVSGRAGEDECRRRTAETQRSSGPLREQKFDEMATEVAARSGKPDAPGGEPVSYGAVLTYNRPMSKGTSGGAGA